MELENDSLSIALTVSNIGESPGKEVVQFYAEKEGTTIDRAPQELQGFVKTTLLQPGQVGSLRLKLPIRSLRYWDEGNNGWTLEPGDYRIKAAASSRDVRKTVGVTL